MKKGELIILNGILAGKIKLPALPGGELYELLSAKADLSALARQVEEKAESIRLSTKPEGVDEYLAPQDDPRVRQWTRVCAAMQTRLYNEELEGTLPPPCISREAFPKMCEGLPVGEAELLMKYLVKP